MDRELETKKILCNNLYIQRKKKGITRRQVAIECGKKETMAANAWGSNIELLANLSGDEDPAEIERRFKKCPFLTVQDLLTLSELFQIFPMDMLKGVEDIYNLPIQKKQEETDSKTYAIKSGLSELNSNGIQKLYDYMADLLKIEEYRN